jgi:hypothetical protein
MRTVQLAYNARLIRKAKTYTEYLSKLKSIAGLRDFNPGKSGGGPGKFESMLAPCS